MHFVCYEMDVMIAALSESGAAPKSLTNVTNICYLLHHRAAIFKALHASNKQDQLSLDRKMERKIQYSNDDGNGIGFYSYIV